MLFFFIENPLVLEQGHRSIVFLLRRFYVTRSLSDMRAVMFGLLMVFGMCMVVEGTRPEKCELPEESGLCRAMFPKFFFNRLTNQCEEFIYGGCGGMKKKKKDFQYFLFFLFV